MRPTLSGKPMQKRPAEVPTWVRQYPERKLRAVLERESPTAWRMRIEELGESYASRELCSIVRGSAGHATDWAEKKLASLSIS